MEHFSVEGSWWLPERTDRRVSGTLNFTADGLELVLYEQLREFPMPQEDEVTTFGPPEWSTTPLVHGRTRDWKDVTLFDVEGAPFEGPVPFEVRESYRVKLAIIGYHADADAFSGAYIEFDRLNSWADPPSIVGEPWSTASADVNLSPTELAESIIDGDSIKLKSGVVGKVGNANVHLDQYSNFVVEFGAPLSGESIVETRVRPLQDLLIFSLGRTVKLTSLKLKPVNADSDQAYCDAYFNTIQPSEARGSTIQASPRSYSEPTLLFVGDSPIAIGELITRWFALWDELRDVLVLLHAPYYAPFMYSENRFASVFQSAEALHKKRMASKELDDDSHKARVKAVVDAAKQANVDTDIVAWAERVLQARNDKPLRQRIEELVRSTGAIGETILNANPKFASNATYARTGVSHPRSLAGKEENVERFWHGAVLSWVVRARLLMDLEVPLPEVEERILQRAQFRHAIDQIRTTTEE
ncbi:MULTISPECIES: HEPN domain-containing protein [unclassified Kribbella]|uniref:ApeA N-terminal domain 1-containing protein n=1 Tax=unclassified Kribbella TaxID=2644121 RepID=UPI003077E5A2